MKNYKRFINIEKCADKVGGKAELSRKTGISPSMLYRYLSGESDPTFSMLDKIAKVCGVTLDWLCYNVNERQSQQIYTPQFIDNLTNLHIQLNQVLSDHEISLSNEKAAMVLTMAMQSRDSHEAQGIAFTSEEIKDIIDYCSGLKTEKAREIVTHTTSIMRDNSTEELTNLKAKVFSDYVAGAWVNLFNTPAGIDYFERTGRTEVNEEVGVYLDNLIGQAKSYLPTKSSYKLLDYGCGSGRHLLHLAKNHNLQLHGIDGADAAAALCTSHAKSNRLPEDFFTQGDLRNTPYSSGSFDIIINFQSLFCFPVVKGKCGAREVFGEVTRLLKDGGIFCGHTFSGDGYIPFPFYQLYNDQLMTSLCGEFGLKLLNSKVIQRDDTTFDPLKRRCYEFVIQRGM